MCNYLHFMADDIKSIDHLGKLHSPDNKSLDYGYLHTVRHLGLVNTDFLNTKADWRHEIFLDKYDTIGTYVWIHILCSNKGTRGRKKRK